MVTETMTDMPEIIIRTAEEREAQGAAARECMAETPHVVTGAISLLIGARAKQEKRNDPDKFWEFSDTPSAIVWAALRTKELSSEGVEVYAFPAPEILQQPQDRRVTLPIDLTRSSGLMQMLEW